MHDPRTLDCGHKPPVKLSFCRKVFLSQCLQLKVLSFISICERSNVLYLLDFIPTNKYLLLNNPYYVQNKFACEPKIVFNNFERNK